MRTKDEGKLLKMLEYINDYYEENATSPSLEDIVADCGMPRSTAFRYLMALRDRGSIEYSRNKISTDKIAKMKRSGSQVAWLGSIACGAPMLEEENIQEYFTLPEKMVGTGKFFLLKARGDSMINAGIEPGDLVLIKQQQEANDGDIIVALTDNNENTLKRIYRENGQVVLRPENDAYEDIIVNECYIQGVAVKVMKNLH